MTTGTVKERAEQLRVLFAIFGAESMPDASRLARDHGLTADGSTLTTQDHALAQSVDDDTHALSCEVIALAREIREGQWRSLEGLLPQLRPAADTRACLADAMAAIDDRYEGEFRDLARASFRRLMLGCHWLWDGWREDLPDESPYRDQ